jgi:hypothetical protein
MKSYIAYHKISLGPFSFKKMAADILLKMDYQKVAILPLLDQGTPINK